MILLIILISTSAFALTEEDIIQSVIKNFPLIEEASLKAKAAESEVVAARGAFDHKLTLKKRDRLEEQYDNHYFETNIQRLTPYHGLSLIAGHRQGTGTFPPYDGKYETSGAGEIFAGLSFPVLRGFQTDEYRTELRIAEIKKDISVAEVKLKKFIYIHKALSLYYKFTFLNKKLQIRKEVLEIAQQRQSMLNKRFKAGDIEKLKLMDNDRSIDKRKDEVEKVKIEQEKVKNELSLYYRDQEGNPILPGEAFPEQEMKGLPLARFNPERLPQIEIIDKHLDVTEIKRKFYDQSKLPELNVELIGAKELSPNEPYDPRSLQIGVMFKFPLENRKARGKAVATEYKYLAMKKEVQFMLEGLKRQLDFSLEAMARSLSRWRIIGNELEKTKDISEAERTRWAQGASDLYIVTLREQEEAETNIKRWNVWLEYHLYNLDARLYSGIIIPPSYQ
ncbi:MAG: TolC family protein [Bacteriovoracia bacterium]